jgi:hypothetical protein
MGKVTSVASTDEAILAPSGAADQETFLESLGQEPRSRFEQEYLAEEKAAEEAWLDCDREGWAEAAIEYRRERDKSRVRRAASPGEGVSAVSANRPAQTSRATISKICGVSAVSAVSAKGVEE